LSKTSEEFLIDIPRHMKQLNLFESKGHYSVPPRAPTQIMSQEVLVSWKNRIHNYQQQTRSQTAPQQTTLFDLSQSHSAQSHSAQSHSAQSHPQDLDPFRLKLHPSLFWRLKESPADWDDSQQGCLYFILDTAVPLLLYIGETKLSANERWSGTHDCKDYILNYLQLHRHYEMEVAVASCFWLQLPPAKKTLQQWERELIYKWRSPFNKEMWAYWGQPFGKAALF
jgi:hypothetical protein